MGNQTPKYKPRQPIFQNWHLQPSPQKHRPQYSTFKVYRNTLTNEEIEQYTLPFNSEEEYHSFLDSFAWRQREEYVVKTKFLVEQSKGGLCSSSYGCKVFTERIPVRLCDIRDIPVPQNLYLLKNGLEGFEKLYGIVGYFKIYEQMVCMDKDGKVKAWLNSDLSKNYVSPLNFMDEKGVPKESHSPQLQHRMVQNFIELIDENTSRQAYNPPSFKNFLENQNKFPLTFKAAKIALSDYATGYHLPIPTYFESVVGLFNSNEPSQGNHYEVQQQRDYGYGYGQRTPNAQRRMNHIVHYEQQPEQYDIKEVGDEEKHFDQSGVEKFHYNKAYNQNLKSQENREYEKVDNTLERQRSTKALDANQGFNRYHTNPIVNFPPPNQIPLKTAAVQPIFHLPSNKNNSPTFYHSPITTPSRPLSPDQVPAHQSGSFKINFKYRQQQGNRNTFQQNIGQQVQSPPVQVLHRNQNQHQQMIASPPFPPSRQIHQIVNKIEYPTARFSNNSTSQQKNTASNKNSKIMYSDSTEQYELDAQIAQDLVKYMKQL